MNNTYHQFEDEKKALSYLINADMTKEQKLKALGDAFWQAHNSGYCDAMANRLMAGQEDAQTRQWEKNCRNKYAIDRLYDWIKENEHD